MTESHFGYALHRLTEGSALSNGLKCKLEEDKNPTFIFPKRSSLVFFEICQSGIKPMFEIPFQKTIYGIRVFPSKLLGKRSGNDLLIVIFSDYSFICFSNPKEVQFGFYPEESEINENSNLISDICNHSSTFFLQNKIGFLLFWDPLENQKTIYNIRCEDMQIIDMKFLYHRKDIRVAFLYSTNAGSCYVVTSNFNRKLLILERVSYLCVNQTKDNEAKFIIPIPLGDGKPCYLIVGQNYISAVYKKHIINIDAPFQNSSPTAYCHVIGWNYLISSYSGKLYLLNIGDKISIIKIGSIPTIPSSITKIDGNYFYIGSKKMDSLFIQMNKKEIKILNSIKQFTPVNSFTLYNEEAGCLFLAQGNNKSSSISTLKTGSYFTKKIEIPIHADNIFNAGNKYIIISLKNGRSLCLDSKFHDVVLHNFQAQNQTINVLSLSQNNIIQVCLNSIYLINSDKYLSFKSDIIFSSFFKSKILILFENKVEVLNKNIEPLYHIKLEKNYKPLIAEIFDEYIIVYNFMGNLKLFEKNKLINEINIGNEVLCRSIFFTNYQNHPRIVCCFENGMIQRYTVPKLIKVSDICIGYLIKNVFRFNYDDLFINGSNPSLLFGNGSSISVICEQHITSFKFDKYVVLLNHNLITIGELQNSSYCYFKQQKCSSRPILMSIHNNPLTLFVSFLTESCYSIIGYSIPSYSEVFMEKLDENEEIVCFYYYKKYNITLFGTATKTNGRIYIIQEIFGKFNIIKSINIDGNVFSINSYQDFIIVGETSKIILYKISFSLSGILNLEQTQVLPVGIIPRFISVVDNYMIYFGALRTIIIFRFENQSLEKIYEYIICSKLQNGFVGNILDKQNYHLFTINIKHEIIIYSCKIIDDSVDIKPLSTIKLNSPVSYFSSARNGYSILSTKDGNLYSLLKYDRNIIKLLNVVSKEIIKYFPTKLQSSRILDSSYLQLYSLLPHEIQTSTAKKVCKTPDEVIDFICTFMQSVSHICSTS